MTSQSRKNAGLGEICKCPRELVIPLTKVPIVVFLLGPFKD